MTLILGYLTEAITGVQISDRLLAEPRYLLTGSNDNPLSWFYIISGLMFLLSAFAYAPLRLLSAWETRKYLSKRALNTRLSNISSNSASATYTSEYVNQQVPPNDISRRDGPSVGDTQTPLTSMKRKGSVSFVYSRKCISVSYFISETFKPMGLGLYICKYVYKAIDLS